MCRDAVWRGGGARRGGGRGLGMHMDGGDKLALEEECVATWVCVPTFQRTGRLISQSWQAGLWHCHCLLN